MKARLYTMGVPLWENRVERARLTQIFVVKPSGIKLKRGILDH